MNKIISFFLLGILTTTSFAAHHTINLVVGYKDVNFAGKTVKAIAVNNQIPAPTLHFKKGDQVTINVHNQLPEETAIHWHGILVPWQMDGVLGVSQQGIQPGKSFSYHFKLMQSGTYWYHAHAGLQEQQGLYGALVIDPAVAPPFKYNKDFVIVLSDWSNTNPENILANLKKDGDYYSPKFPLQPSLLKFMHDYRQANAAERSNLMADYKMMQQMRMSIYDINEVAYDAFLLNGQTKLHPWKASVKLYDVVRLRFIGASAETIFHIKIPDATMQMVHIEGNNIVPYDIQDFTIAPGETYDVLVKINQNKPYLIYAESLDQVGAAYGALVTDSRQPLNLSSITPFPEPLPVTRQMMANSMPDMSHDSGMHEMHMNQNAQSNHDMNMPTEPALIGDKFSPASENEMISSGTKYQNLIAKVKTNSVDKPIADVIKMDLFGYMNHFIWMINGLTEYETKPIILKPGKRYRIIFTNHSMMRHPMHIHGHWFIVRNGHGAYDPLLHTVEVAPSSTLVADVDTDASGQWFFHCHMAYHMTSGMARVLQYSTLIEITKDEAKPQDIVKQTQYTNRPIVKVDEARPINHALVKHPMGHHAGLWLATYLDVGADPFHNVQRLTYKGLYGPDYNKLELFTNDAEVNQGRVEYADMDMFYWHLISQFWAIKGGVNYFYRPSTTPYWQPGIGIEGLMPYFIDTDVRVYDYSGSMKLDLELSRDTQITNNFFIRLGVRSILATQTINRAAIGSGLNQMRYAVRPYYRLMPGLNMFAEYEYERDYGAFKNIQNLAGEPAIENTLTFGLTVLL